MVSFAKLNTVTADNYFKGKTFSSYLHINILIITVNKYVQMSHM